MGMGNNFKEDKTIIVNLEGQTIMKGLESELIKDGVVISLGNSFDMTVNGKLTRVRVDEIVEKNLEATSPRDRITQYNLIVYDEKKGQVK
ncbi:hypothetical protein [Priestia aryabhattai]|uniref:hypothetical protein n=1 Tax=Priestia aryabhattai TaxID=412384 RepID=UPI0008DD0779|nr:hypothetical protein [Priestia aryabhattai]OHY73380.1 hypothetical protein BCV52_27090 [Priestia aryabhattai]